MAIHNGVEFRHSSMHIKNMREAWTCMRVISKFTDSVQIRTKLNFIVYGR